MAEFKDLIGNLIVKIEGATVGNDCINFTTADGDVYRMWHCPDCCESVDVNEIVGDVSDLMNTPILAAEESVNPDESPVDTDSWGDSSTWTFYRITTIHGTVVIRWLGRSNGYYSESVSFDLL